MDDRHSSAARHSRARPERASLAASSLAGAVSAAPNSALGSDFRWLLSLPWLAGPLCLVCEDVASLTIATRTAET